MPSGRSHTELGAKGVTLVLVDVEPTVRKELDDYGLTEAIGSANFYPSSDELLAAYTALPPAVAAAPPPPADASPAPGAA